MRIYLFTSSGKRYRRSETGMWTCDGNPLSVMDLPNDVFNEYVELEYGWVIHPKAWSNITMVDYE